MRYIIIAILSAIGVGLICLHEYYYDVAANGDRYLEAPLSVILIYFALIYMLLLGCYYILWNCYYIVKKTMSFVTKRN